MWTVGSRASLRPARTPRALLWPLAHLVRDFKSPQQSHDFLLEVLLLQDKRGGVRAPGFPGCLRPWQEAVRLNRADDQHGSGTATTIRIFRSIGNHSRSQTQQRTQDGATVPEPDPRFSWRPPCPTSNPPCSVGFGG